MVVSHTLVLVGCGDTKSDEREAAFKLFDSSYFERKWLTGSYLGVPAVASGKHHLLWGHDRVDPYDKTVHDMDDEERREWGETVVEQIPDRYNEIILLMGEVYADPIKEAMDDDTRLYDPFRDCGGIHGQQDWMTERINEVEGR